MAPSVALRTPGLPARRGVGLQIAEDVLDRCQQMLRPALIRIEDVRMAERGEVGAAFAVGSNPRQAVILIGTGALGAEPVRGRAVRLLNVDAQQDVLFLA